MGPLRVGTGTAFVSPAVLLDGFTKGTDGLLATATDTAPLSCGCTVILRMSAFISAAL